jgi:hypothetical protein
MPSPSNPNPSNISPAIGDEVAFSEVVRLIGAAREKAVQAVNAALVDLYWEIGATFVRVLCAVIRDFSAGIMHLYPGKRLKQTGGIPGFECSVTPLLGMVQSVSELRLLQGSCSSHNECSGTPVHYLLCQAR